MRRVPGIILLTLLAASCAEGERAQETSNPTSNNPAALREDAARYRPRIRPADFVDTIDNPYLPFRPGTSYRYEGTSNGEREIITVTVTDRKRKILGISATVVRDQVFVDGELAEDTFDWYAQDRDGNVWYLGEETKEYEDGKVSSTEGSWEAGVDGAQPGIVMLGSPRVGQEYRQEYYKGEAEDAGRVVETGESVKVPYGSFDDVVVTEDFTALEPKILERKYYARGVGLIQERHIRGSKEVTQLVDFER